MSAFGTVFATLAILILLAAFLFQIQWLRRHSSGKQQGHGGNDGDHARQRYAARSLSSREVIE
jgi:hypothetical protein